MFKKIFRRQSEDYKLKFKRSIIMQKKETQNQISELKSNCDNNDNEQSSSQLNNLSKILPSESKDF